MRRGAGVPALFAIVDLLVHLAANRGYGYFRDELYYIACSDHLALGYVDQPPLSIFLLKACRLLLGDSLPSIRLVPAVAGSIVVLLTGLIVREIGGGRIAQALACAGVLIAPVYLAIDNYFSMNSLDMLFWALSFFIVVRVLEAPEGSRPSRRLWLLLGAVLGLGLLNKISVLWLGFGLAAGTRPTPARAPAI